MTTAGPTRAAEFRRLHARGAPLVLPNAWDAGSARLIEACGATAIATTSSGVAWAHGYPDGDALPPRILTGAVEAIARVLSVPLTIDIEGGYSADPAAVGEVVSAVVAGGAVGINIEDGSSPPDLLCAKVAAAKAAATRAGVDLFVNARTDVYLRGLVPGAHAIEETVVRARRYHAAGADGLFVPGLIDADAIRTIANNVTFPLNVMVRPGLPPVAELARLGVRRVSAGSAIAQAVHGLTRRLATALLTGGIYDAMLEGTVPYGELNGMFTR